jgi:hypothetical protein
MLGHACDGRVYLAVCSGGGWLFCDDDVWSFTEEDPSQCGSWTVDHSRDCDTSSTSGEGTSPTSASGTGTSTPCQNPEPLPPGDGLPPGITFGGDCDGDVYAAVCAGSGWIFCSEGTWAYTSIDPSMCGGWTLSTSSCGG